MVSRDLHEALSALADGRASAADWARIEAAWASDPDLRAQWAAWAVIGDGLRSSDLLRDLHPSEALLEQLPAAPPQALRRRRDWLTPLAAAAGIAAVALLVPGLRATEEPAAGASFALASRGASLSGPSFAQTALGPAPGAWPGLPATNGLREAGWGVTQAPPVFETPPIWPSGLPPPAELPPAPRRP